ncbi:MAG: hypothetical protein U0359_41395 [Byssovorax sp.]
MALRISRLLAVLVLAAGCSNPGSPERVADGFADAYFRQIDQEKAKEFTALGATEMLEAELKAVAEVRKGGYSAAEAADQEVTLRRGEPTHRDQRLRYPYEVVLRSRDGVETVREADVELAQIQGAWKVVRLGVHARTP